MGLSSQVKLVSLAIVASAITITAVNSRVTAAPDSEIAQAEKTTPAQIAAATVLMPEDRRSLRATLKQAWEAAKTIELTCEEYYTDKTGEPDKTKTKMIYELLLAKEGQEETAILRSVLKMRTMDPEGKMFVFEEVRRDGVNTYRIIPKDGRPGTQHRVHIKLQENPFDNYEGTMNSVLWLLMPAKQPLHKCLDGDSKVIESDPADRLRTVGVRTKWRNQDLEIKLDPLHGWLPKRVALGSGKTQHYFNVTEFKELKGIWYPALGRFTVATERRELKEKTFKITAIKINHPVGPERFALPILEDGTHVSDEILNKHYIKGPTN